MDNLRALLIQRAARLQERLAFTAPPWDALNYSQFRNRVEGVALGLMASAWPLETPIFCATNTPWDWAAEVAAACCGLRWEKDGMHVPAEILGGTRFNDEQGRGAYHERDHEVNGKTLFTGTLDHAGMLQKLQRMNRLLGWDHESKEYFPPDQIGTPAVRAALWCVLYAGGQGILEDRFQPRTGIFRRLAAPRPVFNPAPFTEFWT